MMAESPWVRIVIVNFNAGPMLQACVDALAVQTMPAFEVVVVDNASTLSPIAALRLPDDRFQIKPAGDNIGFAAATNLGAKGSTCRWLIALNPDTCARPNWLAALRAATEKYPWAKMFGSTQLASDNPDMVDGFGDVLPAFGSAWRSGSGRPLSELPHHDCEVFSPCAAAALYAAPAFASVGGFDGRFFCYLEDLDLGFRLRLRGERCVQVRRAEVLHVGSALTGRQSAFGFFHSYRNRIWLFAKNTPWPLLAPVVVLQGLSIALSLARPRARINQGAALKGLWAGLKGLPEIWRSREAIHRRRVRSSWDVTRMLVWNPLKSRPEGRVEFLRDLGEA